MNHIEITTISISRKNHSRLLELGRKGDTFDDILSEMLDAKKKNERTYSPGADPGK